MNARLKLVAPSSRRTPRTGVRPFKTFYYSRGSREADWSFTGSAKTKQGAVQAAFRRLLETRAWSAVVHDEDGVPCARLMRQGNRIVVVGFWGDAS